MAKVLVAMCVMAYVGGVEERDQARTVRVPGSRVDQTVCQYDHGIRSAIEHPAMVSGVYTVTCADGQVFTAGDR